MKAQQLLNERHVLSPRSFVVLRVWKVPAPVRGSAHDLKYSLVLVENGQSIVRYDNEAGKGDHKHLPTGETSITFTSAAQLLSDFWADVDQWRTI
jgi:pyridoxal biosynthesis lyase PdxS